MAVKGEALVLENPDDAVVGGTSEVRASLLRTLISSGDPAPGGTALIDPVALVG